MDMPYITAMMNFITRQFAGVVASAFQFRCWRSSSHCEHSRQVRRLFSPQVMRGQVADAHDADSRRAAPFFPIYYNDVYEVGRSLCAKVSRRVLFTHPPISASGIFRFATRASLPYEEVQAGSTSRPGESRKAVGRREIDGRLRVSCVTFGHQGTADHNTR